MERRDIPERLLRALQDTRLLDADEPLTGQRRIEWPLTPAELLIVRWASYGLTNQQIADVTGLAYDTVRDQLRFAMRKLRAKNRAHAVALAIRRGLIE